MAIADSSFNPEATRLTEVQPIGAGFPIRAAAAAARNFPRRSITTLAQVLFRALTNVLKLPFYLVVFVLRLPKILLMVAAATLAWWSWDTGVLPATYWIWDSARPLGIAIRACVARAMEWIKNFGSIDAILGVLAEPVRAVVEWCRRIIEELKRKAEAPW